MFVYVSLLLEKKNEKNEKEEIKRLNLCADEHVHTTSYIYILLLDLINLSLPNQLVRFFLIFLAFFTVAIVWRSI